MKLDSAQKIARFSIKNVGSFNSVNISTACSRLAKLMARDTHDRRDDSGSPASGGCRDEVLEAIKTLSTRALNIVGTFQARAVASLLSSLSTLKDQPDPQLVAALLRRSIAMAGTFNPQSLTSLLLACTTLAPAETMAELLDAFLARAAATADLFGPKDIANLMRVLVKVGMAPSGVDRLVKTMSMRARAIAPDFRPKDAATLVWALEVFGAPPIAELANARQISTTSGVVALLRATLGAGDAEVKGEVDPPKRKPGFA